MKDKKKKFKKHQLSKMRKTLKRRFRKKGKSRNKKRPLTSVVTKRIQAVYTDIFAQIVEYDSLFGKSGRPGITDILNVVPREKIIPIAQVLTELYGNAGPYKLDSFFSSHSYRNRALVGRLISKFENRLPPNINYFWTTTETPKQLLRYAFSIPVDQIKPAKLSEEDMELLIFKAVLLLNQDNTHCEIKKENESLENLLFLASVTNMNMHGEDLQSRKDRSIMQLYFSVQFFQMLEANDVYKPLLDAFKRKHGVDDWNEYVRSIFGVLAMNDYMPTTIPADLRTVEGNIVNKKVLDSIALPWNACVKFNSNGPKDRAGNTDYKEFRNKPLIKLDNGDYIFNSWEFVVDRLFNSLYFEFKELNVNKKLFGNINGLFTDTFAEKHLFKQLIEMSVSKDRYALFSEDRMNLNYPKDLRKDGELGPPDYLIQHDKACIIFECKDVRIGGDEIESHNFEVIIDLFSNKLYQKKWHYKNGVKEYFANDKDKRIGITQLTDHLANVRSGNFKYAIVEKDKLIYPVLILSDYKNLHTGFNHIAYDWYAESLDSLHTKSENYRPLIVMSFITLLKYHELFIKYGFETFFENYYKVMFPKSYNIGNQVTSYMSFDDFMGRYQYDLTLILEKMKQVVTKGIRTTS